MAALQQTPRSERLIVLIVLVFAVSCTIGFRVSQLSDKQFLTHDESISYLAASGHQAAFEKARTANATSTPEISERLVGRWVAAAEWKSFVQIEQKLPLLTTRHDLARYDKHPPFYFWVLNLWLTTFGTEVWSGASLNIVIALAMLAAVYGFAQCVLRSGIYAGAVALVWSLSGEIINISVQARPYDLLAVFSVLLAWQTVKFLQFERPLTLLNSALLAITIALGLLTHFHFVIVLAACGLLTILNAKRMPRKFLTLSIVTAAIGVLIAVVAHPDFWLPIAKQLGNKPSGFSEILDRIETSLVAIFSLFGWRGRWIPQLEPLGIWSAIPVFLSLVAVPLLASWVLRRRIELSFPERFVVYISVLTGGVICLLYVGSISPRHAMGARYLAMVWPFAAFFPILVFKALATTITTKPEGGKILVGLLSLAYVGLALLPPQLEAIVETDKRESALLVMLAEAPSVIFDNTNRGVILPLVHALPDETRVFVATQDQLLNAPSVWLSGLSNGDLFVSSVRYQSTKEGQALILAEISKVFATKPVATEGTSAAFIILPP